MPDDVVQRFQKALDSQFAHLGRQAVYKSNQTSKDVLVISRRPEELFALGEERIHGENTSFEFRVVEVPHPLKGDEIVLGERCYQIVSEPQLDQHHLTWSVEALPVIDGQFSGFHQ